MKVNVVRKTAFELPRYQTENAAGMDLQADIADPVLIQPLTRLLVPTGLFMEIPAGFEGQIRPRSGLAYKHGVTVLNAPGTIDADYRGEVKVLLVNLSNEPYQLNPGDRVAQIVFAKAEQAEWIEAEILSDTSRGEGGFGHTGK